MKVTVVSEDLVKPEVSLGHPEILELNAIDQVQPRFNGPPVIAFLPPLPEGVTFESFIQKSKAAFAKNLVAFYPLAGRLVTREQGCLAVHCTNDGILLRTAQADCKMPQEMATGTSLVGSEALWFNKMGEELSRLPLLLLQFTRFQDNSLCIYLGCHHSVVDGIALQLFMLCWNALMLGDEVPFEPVHDRFLIRASGKELVSNSHPVLGLAPRIPLLAKFVLNNSYLRDLLFSIPRGLIMPDAPLNRLLFSKAKLKELQEEISKGLPEGRSPSTDDALTALMWQSITVARGLHKKPEQTTRLASMVNFRSRIQPPLPETYFGNTHVPTISDAAAQELVSKPLSWSASLVRDSVARVDSEYVQTMIDWIAIQPNKGALGLQIQSSQGPDLLISSASNSPLGALNLGWGPAVSVGPAQFRLPLDGYVLLIPTSNGICAYVSLLAAHMKKLLQYEPLMRYVG